MGSEAFSGHRIVDHFQGVATLPAAASQFTIIPPRRGETVSIGASGLESQALVDNENATAGSNLTITKAAAGWTIDAYIGEIVLITADSGGPSNVGQTRTITTNSATVLTFAPALPAAASATTVFAVYQRSRYIPIVRAIEFHHTGVAGTLSMLSTGFPSGTTSVTNSLYFYNSAATSGISITGGAIIRVGTQSGDVRALTSAANTGTIFVEGYWVNNAISLTATSPVLILPH